MTGFAPEYVHPQKELEEELQQRIKMAELQLEYRVGNVDNLAKKPLVFENGFICELSITNRNRTLRTSIKKKWHQLIKTLR